MMGETHPLVSIIVVTYNSSEFVIETLESAKAQIYDKVELIISDDGSSDNTVHVCKEWLSKNNDRFENTVLLASQSNRGIPSNCNRGIDASHGEWIKLIAGDDILEDECIHSFIVFLSNHPEARVILSKQRSFFVKDQLKSYVNIRPEIDKRNEFFYNSESTASIQYEYLLYRKVLIAGPTYFIKKSLITEVGCFDEKYRLFEDYPLFINILEKGERLYFLDQVTINYRIRGDSVSTHNQVDKIYPDYYFEWYDYLFKYNIKHISIPYKIDLVYEWLIFRIIVFFGNKGHLLLKLNNNYHKFSPLRFFRFIGVLK
jgi:glycosyltransferase involved in cell wall biosynthesis